jgi:hypothetical protein
MFRAAKQPEEEIGFERPFGLPILYNFLTRLDSRAGFDQDTAWLLSVAIVATTAFGGSSSSSTRSS